MSTPLPLQQTLRLARARHLASSGEGRRRRLDARLSLNDVALAVGCAQTTVLRWEEGTSRPTGSAALAYAELIDKLPTGVVA